MQLRVSTFKEDIFLVSSLYIFFPVSVVTNFRAQILHLLVYHVRLFVNIFKSTNALSPGLADEVLTVKQHCARFVCGLLYSAVGTEDFVAWMVR